MPEYFPFRGAEDVREALKYAAAAAGQRVRFRVDQNLHCAICQPFASAGHDVVHVRSVSLDRADDAEILKYAARERRAIISSDTDFGALLAPPARAVLPWR